MEARGNQPISEQEAIAWLKQLAVILKLVHDKHYLHRDIKPSNVMLRTPPYQGGAGGGQLVLIDFGTAREVTKTYLAKIGSGQGITAIVSSGYTAPEQANGEARVQSDFFALGRTFVFLLTGRYPNTMYDARTDQLNWRSHTSGISPGLLNLVDWLMARDPNQRPANAQAILDRLVALDRDNISLAETVNVVGAAIPQPLPPPETTATLPPREIPPQDQDSGKLPFLAFLAFLIVALSLLGFGILVLLGSKHRSLPKNAQAPQEKGEVDYFPYVEGTDSQGRTAEFNVAVLSREYKWQLGSSYQAKYNDRLLPIDALQSDLEAEGIQRIMENPSEVISVGTASCEGSQAQEERRAFERSKQIQLLAKKLFSKVPSVQNYRLLNLGQFRGVNCNSNQDETSYQRSIIIIGVRKQSEGLVLDEALRSRLQKKPFGDFQLQDYSLGSPDKFKTIPSRLE
jgi:hypothetical protein